MWFSGSDANDRKRKKKSRWGGSDLEKTFIPGMPTVLPHNLTKEQEEAYICKFISLLIILILNVLTCAWNKLLISKKQNGKIIMFLVDYVFYSKTLSRGEWI